MSRRASPRIVGLFVLGAVALGVGALAIFGSGRFFRESHTFVAYFHGKVGGLNPGAPVKFRGVELGQVQDVRLNLDESVIIDVEDITIPVIFDVDARRLRARGAVLDMGDPAVIDSMIRQVGLRATLNVESIVTGRMYIELDILPRNEAHYHAEESRYREIPTALTGFEQIQEKLQDVISELGDVDLDSILSGVHRIVAGVEEIIRSPEVREGIGALSGAISDLEATLLSARGLMATADSSIGPLRASLTRTSDRFAVTAGQLDSTLVSMRAVLEPGSPIIFELETALQDLAAATRALRSLSEFLERNPSALLRGRPDDKP